MKGLEQNLKADVAGEVYFDMFNRGRYATDASHYQVMPAGVVVPRTTEDVRQTLFHARAEGVPVLARGGGSSQCGQTVGPGLVVDHSKYLNRMLELDLENRRCVVEPGIVLDELNAQLQPHGLWFPVDVSTSSRATLGGMAGNNSAGSRSIRYGLMRDNVLSIAATLADGSDRDFGTIDPAARATPAGDELTSRLLQLGERAQQEILERFPRVLRRVGGYNIDALVPDQQPTNLAHLLVGSEGTLAYFRSLELKLSERPKNKVLGVCHFPTFYAAMDSAQHLVKLDPTAVELIDRTMIELSRDIALFRPVVDRFVRGNPEALLLVEFAEDEQQENLLRLARLTELMGDLGYDWQGAGARWGGVVEVVEDVISAGNLRCPQTGPQYHDVDEGGAQTNIVRRGLCRRTRGPGRIHGPVDRHLYQAQHYRDLVRPCLGRLSPCAAGTQSPSRQGYQGNAFHRRRGY